MNNLQALIIEDDPKLANIFAQALRIVGFETESIQDGQAAINRLLAATPAVVVLDLHLPLVSGKEILSQIRGDERLKATRVILVTADPLMAETLRADVDLVLIKPIGFNQLRDLAKRLKPTQI
jgi:DNA-binding response OmpR family regulator